MELKMETITIDGSVGEGGGQILRTSLALAMVTGQRLLITRIRAQRPRPGLMRQHLTCVQAAAAVCSAQVEGATLGAQSVRFTPGPVRAGDYTFNVGTAGSCTLVLQTILPALMLADTPSRVRLGGGTHNPLAPPYHFLARAFAPLLRRLGVGIDLELRRHGFYPAGGGEVAATITPATGGLTPVDVMARGGAVDAYAECLAPGLRRSVAARELETLGLALGWSGAQLRALEVPHEEGPGNALMATLVHDHLSEVFTRCGAKGISSEAVAQMLAAEVRAFQARPGALGPCLADQWMLPLALAVARTEKTAGFTCTEVTEHARTNIGVIERFLPVRFTVGEAGSGWKMRLTASKP
jgi:RNA 3'-terminal phosphate cyclase (ATP)